MFVLSAFADEIDPDPVKQLDVLDACRVRHIEFRSIYKTNVLDLTDTQIQDFKALLDRRGFKLSAIGSPVGKYKIDDPFEPHLKRFRRAVELCGIFGTPNIRVFSYYPRDGATWDTAPEADVREVFRRMAEKANLAEKAGMRLFHENEHRIYGDSPDRLVKLFDAVQSPALRAAYDPANFVFCGYDPWEGWQKTKHLTAHFHIKDWSTGETHGRLPGEGMGRIPEVIAEAVAMGYDGFATMEPHLLGGGPTGGVTGPELYPKAVAAFQAILDKAGAKYQ